MIAFRGMRYAVWNNKGGVGKSFLTFVLATEVAHRHPDKHVVVVDMCPQANLSEIVLGGNGAGAKQLQKMISSADRKTIGGYFDSRITSPHQITGSETSFLIQAHRYNRHLPLNVSLIVGDPSLEIQAQVINQIGVQALPPEAWRNVHNWLRDLIAACIAKQGDAIVFIDCNPSFSAYTELSMMAADRLIIPCSSDGSSARAIDNVGSLLYGIGGDQNYGDVTFKAKAAHFGMSLPVVHSVLLNRSTQYSQKASKAFGAMFTEIKKRTNQLYRADPSNFVTATGGRFKFHEIPDNHSVAIVCSHLGRPLYSIGPGKYKVHDTSPQVNPEPLDRYKTAVEDFLAVL
jgi:chromosome partitioning protein